MEGLNKKTYSQPECQVCNLPNCNILSFSSQVHSDITIFSRTKALRLRTIESCTLARTKVKDFVLNNTSVTTHHAILCFTLKITVLKDLT